MKGLIAQMESQIRSINHIAVEKHKEATLGGLKSKQQDMRLRLQVMRFKYDGYKRYLDMAQIIIIMISTSTAITEAFKGELNFNNASSTAPAVYHLFQLLPIITSSFTAFLAAIIKFKKYSERMELLGRTIEGTISTMSRQGRVIDQIAATNSMSEIGSISKAMQEVTEAVVDNMARIAAVLKWSDIVEHLPRYQRLTLTYLQSEKDFACAADMIQESQPQSIIRRKCQSSRCCVM